MTNEANQRPIRAGRAYVQGTKDGALMQAALQRMQPALQRLSLLFSERSEVINRASAALQEPSHAHRRLIKAMSDAMRSADFSQLRALTDHCPELRQAAIELEAATCESHAHGQEQVNELRRRLRLDVRNLGNSFDMPMPLLGDPDLWASITPIGEHIRDTGSSHAARATRLRQSWRDVAAQLERFCDAGGPYMNQRLFSRLCGCRPSTVNKAIKQNSRLRAWKDAALKSKKQASAPRRACGDFGVILENQVAKQVEPVSHDDIDVILKKLGKQAAGNPEWLEALRNLGPAERVEIAQLYSSGDYEPSPLDDDPPDQRPRPNKFHGSV